jgi:DNA-binding MarR family transcriptional regulator
MSSDPIGAERVPIPTLLRRARRAYAAAIQGALADAGCDDVPRNGAFVLAATAATGVQLGQIIRELRVSKQAAGQLIDALVSRGYLVRSVDQQDRRRLNITLTDRGMDAAEVIGAAIGSVNARLARRVSEEDIQAARRVLTALIDLDLHPHPHPPGDGPPGGGAPGAALGT